MNRQLYRKYVLDMCGDAARGIWDRTPPNTEYAEAIQRLLFMTWAHESDMFQASRQYGFTWRSDIGGWGPCQIEEGSVTDSMRLLQRKPNLATRVAQYVGQSGRGEVDWLLALQPKQVLRLLPVSERLSAAFCRLHYLRVPAAIPRDLNAAAEYAKRYYNTELGKATPEKYLQAYRSAMGGL